MSVHGSLERAVFTPNSDGRDRLRRECLTVAESHVRVDEDEMPSWDFVVREVSEPAWQLSDTERIRRLEKIKEIRAFHDKTETPLKEMEREMESRRRLWPRELTHAEVYLRLLYVAMFAVANSGFTAIQNLMPEIESVLHIWIEVLLDLGAYCLLITTLEKIDQDLVIDTVVDILTQIEFHNPSRLSQLGKNLLFHVNYFLIGIRLTLENRGFWFSAGEWEGVDQVLRSPMTFRRLTLSRTLSETARFWAPFGQWCVQCVLCRRPQLAYDPIHTMEGVQIIPCCFRPVCFDCFRIFLLDSLECTHGCSDVLACASLIDWATVPLYPYAGLRCPNCRAVYARGFFRPDLTRKLKDVRKYRKLNFGVLRELKEPGLCQYQLAWRLLKLVMKQHRNSKLNRSYVQIPACPPYLPPPTMFKGQECSRRVHPVVLVEYRVER